MDDPTLAPPQSLFFRRGLLVLLLIEALLMALSIRFANLQLYVLPGLLILGIGAGLFVSNMAYLVLGYIAVLPIIQELSFHGIEFGDFLVTPHMLVQFLITIAILTHFLSSYGKQRRYPLGSIDKAFLVFVLLTGFSLVYPYTLPVNHTKRWLLFYTGIVETVSFYYIVLYVLIRQKDITQKILFALLLTSFSSLIVGYLEIQSVGFDLLEIFSSRMRIGFGYHNPNLFGIHSVVIFPLAFYALSEKRLSRWRMLTASSLAILTVLSLLCFNRGTIIVLALELFLVYLIGRHRRLLYAFLISMAVIAITWSNVIGLYLMRFVTGVGESSATMYLDPSSFYRLEAWKVGLGLLFSYPFGVGAGGFQYAWRLYGTDPSFYLGTPHQLFLSIGDDYGVFAMLVFAGILIAAYRYATILSRNEQRRSPINLYQYIRISIVGFIVYGMITDGELSHLTGFTAPNNGYTLLFFTLLAIVSFHYSSYRNNLSSVSG